MPSTNYVKTFAGPLVILLLVGVGWQTRATWTGWLVPAKESNGDSQKAAAPDSPERVKLSAQAEKNLRLIVKPTVPTTYQRKIYLPGTVVDKPGHSDRGIPAPIAGVTRTEKAISKPNISTEAAMPISTIGNPIPAMPTPPATAISATKLAGTSHFARPPS